MKLIQAVTEYHEYHKHEALVNMLHPYLTVCNLIKENGITQCIKVQMHIFIVFEV